MKVINVFGGPGAGKSTIAAGLFYKMKIEGHSVELVTEYAKDVTWEKRSNLFNDQLYLLAKQQRRINRLLDHPVDYVITDSPILLSAAYARCNGVGESSALYPLILELFNSYTNVNVVLERQPDWYQAVGRTQTLSQAITVDEIVLDLLDEWSIPHTTIRTSPDYDSIDAVYGLITKA